MAECEAYLSGIVMDYESKHNLKVSAIAIPFVLVVVLSVERCFDNAFESFRIHSRIPVASAVGSIKKISGLYLQKVRSSY